MSAKGQRVRDPVHNLIEFTDCPVDRVLWSLIQTPAMQRLRRIKQLGFSEFVYPGATHTRFSHSLGVCHLAKQLIGHINQIEPKKREELKESPTLIAALLHDIGHGPFSHAFETAMKRARPKGDIEPFSHETMGVRIIEDEQCGIARILNGHDDGLARKVARIIQTGRSVSRYGAVVSSQFDADRLDYMQRDRLMTGTNIGAVDFAWLIANLELNTVPVGVEEEQAKDLLTFTLNAKAFHAAESYLLGLFHLYPTIYFHKATRCLEHFFIELFGSVVEHVDAGKIGATGLPAGHPIIRFIQDPSPMNYLNLDDAVIMGSLCLLMESSDITISDFSRRILHRDLYKCVDLYEKIAPSHGESISTIMLEPEKIKELNRRVAEISTQLLEWSNDNSKGRLPRILYDKAGRNSYKQLDENKGSLNQIYIKVSSGECVDIKDLSHSARNTRPFECHRVYYEKGDDAARDEIQRLIEESAR